APTGQCPEQCDAWAPAHGKISKSSEVFHEQHQCFSRADRDDNEVDIHLGPTC
ncbi:unnamed protein product, partial [Rangifer tarandus platyrhynchus]